MKKVTTARFAPGIELTVMTSALPELTNFQVLDDGEVLIDVNEDMWLLVERDEVFSTYKRVVAITSGTKH